MALSVFIQQFINFLQLGSIYALTAISFSMVYGIAGLVNFAHGSIFTVSMYFLFFLSTALFKVTESAWLVYITALVVASVATALIGVAVERFAYKPLRSAPAVATVVSSVGVGMTLEYLMLNFAGSKAKRMPALIPDHFFTLSGVTIPLYKVMIVVIAVAAMVVLSLLIKKTKLGVAMRAVSRDFETSELMGIKINNVISLTFVIGCFLAAVGSLLYFSNYASVIPTSGAMPGLKAFVAAVFGGIGSVPGAVIGAFIIGICENIIKGMGWTAFSDAFTFVLLIVILLAKPTGIFGEKATDKV